MTEDIELEAEVDGEIAPLWVVVKSKHNLFGFDAGIVGNMIAIPKVTRVPDGIDYMPGTITVRGSIIPLIDFRIYTGQPSANQDIDDFCQLMDQRLKDHQNWITELKASIDEEREFKLATDPHKCAFGKWYDNYKSDDRMINHILKKFDGPHKAIHSIAEKVNKLVRENKCAEAHESIDRTSGTELLRMVALFTEIKEAVREAGRRRIAMVLEIEGKTIALDIDEVVSVEHISNIENAPKRQSGRVDISRIGRREKNDDIVLLMDKLDF
jgi:purine-binding chemotaxis protein CheW